MNILVTGAVGFIGFSLCKTLIKKKHKVFGIDNFDTYYSIGIKKKTKNIK
jgi:UDP-glucuronate 4-epimerase